MKTIRAIIFIITVFTVGCVDNDAGVSLAGTYHGTFYRMQNNVRVLESTVTVTFDNGVFSGNSSDRNSPAICNGSYATAESEINFENKCMFTADFDWTLILSGKFAITKSDDAIILSKEKDAGNGDYYFFDLNDHGQ
jgi:hypothetical protein